MEKIDRYKRNIPNELKNLKQWLVYKEIPRKTKDGKIKIAKIPYSAITLSAKDWNDTKKHSSFEHALSVLVKNKFDGLSFALTDNDPYVCIDLDNSVDKDGKISIFAMSIVKLFDDTYREISCSNRGLHIFLKGEIDKNMNMQSKGIEMYSNNRTIAMTGNIETNIFEKRTEILNYNSEIKKLYNNFLPKNKPIYHNNYLSNFNDVPDIKRVIETMLRVNNTARTYFENGNISNDCSLDDFKFLLLLRSFTHADESMMKEIFLQSALSRLGENTKRKNDEGYLKYLNNTINKVNRVGNNDFWKYENKKLTQREVL